MRTAAPNCCARLEGIRSKKWECACAAWCVGNRKQKTV